MKEKPFERCRIKIREFSRHDATAGIARGVVSFRSIVLERCLYLTMISKERLINYDSLAAVVLE